MQTRGLAAGPSEPGPGVCIAAESLALAVKGVAPAASCVTGAPPSGGGGAGGPSPPAPNPNPRPAGKRLCLSRGPELGRPSVLMAVGTAGTEEGKDGPGHIRRCLPALAISEERQKRTSGAAESRGGAGLALPAWLPPSAVCGP